jgi:hypothetical protein
MPITNKFFLLNPSLISVLWHKKPLSSQMDKPKQMFDFDIFALLHVRGLFA